MNNEINPEMILLARESRGITQSALAEKLNVTQAAISKAEKIQGKTSEVLLQKIAKYLDYPVNFFFQQEHYYPPATPFHRKQRSLGKKLQQQIEAEANVRRIHIQKFLDSIDINNKNGIPCFDIDSYGTAAEVANATRRYLQLPKGPIQNITNIIEGLGIPLVLCSFNTDKLDAFTLIAKRNAPVIFVNNNMPWCRVRFTLAHELGHIVMNHIQKPGIEDEATDFASAFLMPDEDIEKDFLRKKVTIFYLADLKLYWKVSMQALLTTAGKRDYITPSQSTYLWKIFSSSGYRKKEPYDLKPETPSIIASMIKLHTTELEYTEEELFQILATNKESFFTLYPFLNNRPPKLRLVV